MKHDKKLKYGKLWKIIKKYFGEMFYSTLLNAIIDRPCVAKPVLWTVYYHLYCNMVWYGFILYCILYCSKCGLFKVQEGIDPSSQKKKKFYAVLVQGVTVSLGATSLASTLQSTLNNKTAKPNRFSPFETIVKCKWRIQIWQCGPSCV